MAFNEKYERITQEILRHHPIDQDISNDEREVARVLNLRTSYTSAKIILIYSKNLVLFCGISLDCQPVQDLNQPPKEIQPGTYLVIKRKDLASIKQIIEYFITHKKIIVDEINLPCSVRYRGKLFLTPNRLFSQGLSALNIKLDEGKEDFTPCSLCYFWYPVQPIDEIIISNNIEIDLSHHPEYLGSIIINLPNYMGGIEFRYLGNKDVCIEFAYQKELNRGDFTFDVLGVKGDDSLGFEYWPLVHNLQLPDHPYRIHFDTQETPPKIIASLFQKSQLISLSEGSPLMGLSMSMGVVTRQITPIQIIASDYDEITQNQSDFPITINSKEKSWLYNCDDHSQYKNLFEELEQLQSKSEHNENYEISIQKEVYLKIQTSEGAEKVIKPRKISFSIEDRIISESPFTIGNFTLDDWTQRIQKRIETKLQEGQGKKLPAGMPGKEAFRSLLKDNISDYLDIIDPYFDESGIELVEPLVPNCDVKIIGGMDKKNATGIYHHENARLRICGVDCQIHFPQTEWSCSQHVHLGKQEFS